MTVQLVSVQLLPVQLVPVLHSKLVPVLPAVSVPVHAAVLVAVFPADTHWSSAVANTDAILPDTLPFVVEQKTAAVARGALAVSGPMALYSLAPVVFLVLVFHYVL